MTTITREQAQKIIEAADEVISALAGTNEDVHPGSDNMLRLWDDLNDRYAPPEVVRELARIVLASLEAEPVAYIIQDSDARSRGEKGILRYFANISDEDINEYEITVTPLYAAPPETVSVPDAMEMDDDFDSAFEHGKAVGWNAYRAAMLQSGNFRENKNSSTNNFREIAETSTNYPVIPSEVLSAIQKVAKIRADFDDFDGDRRGICDCLDEAEQELIVTINKYASQLAAEPIAPNDVREQTAIPQVPVTPDGWISCSERMPEDTKMLLAFSQGEIVAAYWNWVVNPIDYKKYRAFTYLSGNILDDVTHWMPLPEPPQEVNRG
ncbi:DUF551 domain-containing protein [Escherichia coli]|nr:DUF551 domain-containing protein [Escherichia coli]EMA1211969.1 DUF551 domain-containing protein [Escherichia coli]